MKCPRALISLSVVLGTLAGGPAWADAPPPPGCTDGVVCPGGNQAGISIGMTRQELLSLPKYPGDSGGVGNAQPTVWYEYGMTTGCTGDPPGSATADVMCMHAVTACQARNAQGPLMIVWRRQQGPDATDTTWYNLGDTCVTDVIPSGPPRPTIYDIQREFSLTPWSRPTLAMQPPNGQTLIGMPTFYRVVFPAAGYSPGEIHAVTLLGYRFEIRPVLVGYTYHFGDGASFGPTTSAGGVYPDGDIQHAYTTTGTKTPTVTVRYTGEFRIGTGVWAPIPGAVNVTGPAGSITVREARAVLVNH